MTETEKNLRDETKVRLLKAAGDLFARKGFDGVSVKEIADAADANVALVSYHFGGKKGLYEACFNQFVDEWIQFVETKILRPTSMEDFRFKLRVFIESMVDDELENPEACCIIRREMEGEGSEVSDIARNAMARFFEVIGGFIKSAQKLGYIRNDLDHNDLCILFFGGIQHALRVNHMRTKLFGESLADPKVRDRFMNAALELFFNGLSSKNKKQE